MIFSALVKLAALIVLLLLGGIIVSLIFSSWPSIQKFGFSFLWNKEWDAPNETFGALVPIYGTLVTSFIALLIAVPVSFGIALFLTELAPGWLKRPLGSRLNCWRLFRVSFTACGACLFSRRCLPNISRSRSATSCPRFRLLAPFSLARHLVLVSWLLGSSSPL
jgi:hypothetical protein